LALESFSGFLPPENHFHTITEGLYEKGWVVVPDFLDQSRWLSLFMRARAIADYTPAGIGRGGAFQENSFVRNDSICWLGDSYDCDVYWLDLMEQLRKVINSKLFLGLFEFESHFARYNPGSFYKRHLDAFKGQGIRIVSVVLYLNPQWQQGEGGELVIYPEDNLQGIAVAPCGGTLAVFLSEDFPHEVLPATRTRFSIAGWFRVNMTTGYHLDPAA